MNDKRTYSEMLKDPQWQRKRNTVLDRDGYTCQHCFDTTKTLHVHHLRYKFDCKPWEYELDDFITLCEDCHRVEEDLRKAAKNVKDRLKVLEMPTQTMASLWLAMPERYNPAQGLTMFMLEWTINIAGTEGTPR